MTPLTPKGYTSHTVTTELVPAKELRSHLAEHLDQVLAGESFVVTRNGRAIAQLGPVEERSTVRAGERPADEAVERTV